MSSNKILKKVQIRPFIATGIKWRLSLFWAKSSNYRYRYFTEHCSALFLRYRCYKIVATNPLSCYFSTTLSASKSKIFVYFLLISKSSYKQCLRKVATFSSATVFKIATIAIFSITEKSSDYRYYNSRYFCSRYPKGLVQSLNSG